MNKEKPNKSDVIIDLNKWNKKQKEFEKQYKKELKDCLNGNKKAVVFINKYGIECWAIPCYLKKVYGFDLENKYIKVKEINKEDFIRLYKIEEEIKKLNLKKKKLIRSFLKR